MIKFRQIGLTAFLLSLACACSAQGTSGGILYASDFAKWTLPTGNTPAQGTILWPNQEICKVSPAGYNFIGPKVGRQVKIVDANPALTETVTPSAVSIGNSGCMLSGTMAHSHSTYSVQSATAGLQEALDYQAQFSQGAIIVLTPAWTGAGGITGMITSASGSSNISILDERLSVIIPYVWSGSAYVAQPFAGGGAVVPSTQFSLFYQPNSGSSATAQGDPNATTDGSGHVTIVSLKTTATGLSPSTATVCPNGTGGALTTSGCAAAGGSVSGQANGVVPLATGATAITAQSHLDDGITTAGTITSTRNFAVPLGTIIAQTGFGSGYAKQFQTGGGNNGLLNCFAAGNSTCIADPSYASTEKYSFAAGGKPAPGPSNTTAFDYSNGQTFITCHDPFLATQNLVENCQTLVMYSTTSQGGLGRQNALHIDNYQLNPGIDNGNAPVGAQNWTVGTGVQIFTTASSPGIHQSLNIQHNKPGIGDTEPVELYSTDANGSIATSDEGPHMIGWGGGEGASEFAGTVNTGGGGAGATTVKTTCTQDCAQAGAPNFAGGPGNGRFLVDATTIDSGFISGACTAPTATVAGSCPIDHAITASTAYGTLNGSCNTGATPTPLGTGYNSVTCSVNVTSGTFNTTGLVCFVGQFHEQALVTSVTGSGPFTLAMQLRHAHQTASEIYQGGPCGQYLNLTANNQSQSGTMHFPRDIVGAKDTTHISYNGFFVGTNQNGLGGNLYTQTFAATTLNNFGGVVYFSSTINTAQHPEALGNTVQFSSATVSAYNGACTGLKFYTSTGATVTYKCTQASSAGAATSATATYSFGDSQYGTTAYTTYNGGETLDVLDRTASPPVVFNGNPANQVTLTLEPNAAAWANADVVWQPHHYAAQRRPFFGGINSFNPETKYLAYMTLLGGGAGTRNANVSTPSNGSTYVNLQNAAALNNFSGHGGIALPPGGITVGGGSAGANIFNYGLSMPFAPEPSGSDFLYSGCPVSGCAADPNFRYSIFALQNNAGTGGITYAPYQGEVTALDPWIFSQNFAATIFQDSITLQNLNTLPVLSVPVPVTSGGTLADTHQYFYTVYAKNTRGNGAQSVEKNATTGTSGALNSMNLVWTRVQASTGYTICRGDTTGTETILVSLTGADTVTWTDNGSLTPSGACSAADGSLGGLRFVQAGVATTQVFATAVSGTANILLPGVSGTLALLASPALTGTPTAPTATTGDNSTAIATTAFVKAQAYATLAAPTFTGTTTFSGPPIIGGTKFTTAACSISATSGNGATGTFTLGSNSCTAVITINGATGMTAATGWSCQAHDRTAPTVLIGGESSSSTTTASFIIPAGAGATDVISFHCDPF